MDARKVRDTMEAIDTVNPIHRISVDPFHRMIGADVFAEGDGIELTSCCGRDRCGG